MRIKNFCHNKFGFSKEVIVILISIIIALIAFVIYTNTLTSQLP